MSPWWGSNCRHYLWFCHIGKLSLLLIHVFLQSYIYILIPTWTHRCLLYTLSYNPILFIFLHMSFLLWASEAPSFGSCVLPTSSTPMILLLKHCLALWHCKALKAHFVCSPLQPQNEPFLRGAPVPFTRAWHQIPRSGTRWTLHELYAETSWCGASVASLAHPLLRHGGSLPGYAAGLKRGGSIQ